MRNLFLYSRLLVLTYVKKQKKSLFLDAHNSLTYRGHLSRVRFIVFYVILNSGVIFGLLPAAQGDLKGPD